MAKLGVDFGTSNSAAGVCRHGKPALIPLEGQERTMPTTVFLDFHARKSLFGHAAIAAMIEGQDGRFMRALKSVLGTGLAREKRQFLNERLSLIELIARFLDQLRHSAERQTGERYTSVLSGRPVRFHSASADRDARAAEDLTAAYKLAGFREVDFLPEPEAAAIAAQGIGRVLVVDIGGGTSDFTLCDLKNGKTQILASQGLRLGGTNFDKMISLTHVMPLLGKGAEIGNEMGNGVHTAPASLFNDLASWEKITFMYDAALLRDVRKWTRLARNPRLFERLAEVLDMQLGHDVAFAVEAGKIAANDATDAQIDLSVVEPGLAPALSQKDLFTELSPSAREIGKMALATALAAGVPTQSVDRVVFVGGSSLLGAVQSEIRAAFPEARFEISEVFTAVADGLALSAGGA